MATKRPTQLSLDEALRRSGELGQYPPFEVAKSESELLDSLPVDWAERIQVIGGALVVEALQPVWAESASADEAHAKLRLRDPELASAIEGLAALLLGRYEARAEGKAAVEAVEELLRSREGRSL
jgi:hypothetical protein